MLNALRHQRFGTCRSGITNPFLSKVCSTPYGIRGLAQRDRKKHPWLSSCSTPYGIRGLARHPTRNYVTIFLCSTPYGIRGLAR